MVSFEGSLTNSPTFNTSNPISSLKRWAMYIVGLGLMFVAFGLAQTTVAPFVSDLLSTLTGGAINSGEGGVEVRF